MKKLLLISNSTNYGEQYLEHCIDEMLRFMAPYQELLFIPYADSDWEGYAGLVKKTFALKSVKVTSIHEGEPQKLLSSAKVFFVGGGNTFRLLSTLQDLQLLEQLRQKVMSGMIYMGASAGSNLACPTIMTTNDMPIVQPSNFQALNLIPFQINPHFVTSPPGSQHMGETRPQRIKEFIDQNQVPVLGLPEGSWLRVNQDRYELVGKLPAKWFSTDGEQQDIFEIP